MSESNPIRLGAIDVTAILRDAIMRELRKMPPLPTAAPVSVLEPLTVGPREPESSVPSFLAGLVAAGIIASSRKRKQAEKEQARPLWGVDVEARR